MRIASGVTDQYIYFVAVDAADHVTFETGLSSFTVRRSRNGGASAAYTTPTINETDSSNMPGVYELLLDEDMTIDSGDEEQDVCLRITHAGMAPVTLKYTLFRPKITAGETLNVSSGALNAISDGLLTAAKFASDFLTAAKVASDVGTEIATAVWASATRLLTAGTNIVLAKGTGVTGFNDLDAAGIRAAVGLASANLDTQLSTIDGNVDDILVDTGTDIPAALTTIDGVVDTIQAKTDNLPSDPADASVIAGLIDALPTANENADALLDRSNAVESGVTLRGWLRVVGAVLLGKASGGGTGTETFRDMEADSKDRVISSNDQDGNRSAVTLDMT